MKKFERAYRMLREAKQVVKQYQTYTLGYDNALDRLIKMGWSEVQADEMLVASKRVED